MKILTPCKIVSVNRRYHNGSSSDFYNLELVDFNYRFIAKNLWCGQQDETFNVSIEIDLLNNEVYYLYDGVGASDRVQCKIKIDMPYQILLDYWDKKKNKIFSEIDGLSEEDIKGQEEIPVETAKEQITQATEEKLTI